MEDKYKVVCALSNSATFDDLERSHEFANATTTFVTVGTRSRIQKADP